MSVLITIGIIILGGLALVVVCWFSLLLLITTSGEAPIKKEDMCPGE